MSNYKHIFGPVYVVRTQAGLRQAIKDYHDGEWPEDIRGYPTSYPAVVSFEHRYNGGCYVFLISSEHVNLVKGILENNDASHEKTVQSKGS